MAATKIADIQPTTWTISPPQSGTKGNKTCLLSDLNRKQIELNLGGPFRSPFGHSSYDDSESSRQNLDLTLTDENLITKFLEIDETLIRHAVENPSLFKGNPTPERIRESYKSLLRQREGYRPMLRTKINLDTCRYWNSRNEPRDIPENRFKDADLWVKLQVKTLWISNSNFGLTLQISDIKIQEDETLCPFPDDNE